jgi:pyridoxine kinase
VVYGAAGNSAAVFPLQRLGNEVWPINTVEFSNHTGYGAWRGPVFDGAYVDNLVTGIEERGVLPRCQALLSGYIGAADIGGAVDRAVVKVKTANPSALYCCDPVMGDSDRGAYVEAGIISLFCERLVKKADVITPNLFEFETLTGHRIETAEDVARGLDRAHTIGPATVLVTSFRTRKTAADSVGLLASGKDGVWLVKTPFLRFPTVISGSGDLTTAVFLSHLLAGRSLPDALSATASSVYAVMEGAWRLGVNELPLARFQDALVSPARTFDARRL